MAADLTVKLEARVNWRRYHAIVQEARGRVRRAVRNERPAMIHRYAQRLADCVRVELAQ